MKHHDTSSPWNLTVIIRVACVTIVLALLAAIAIPNFVRARVVMSMDSCSFHQMWIETAKRQWAAENRKPADTVPTEAVVLTYMRQVTPMWCGRKHAVDLPAQLPTCFLNQLRYAIGSAGQPIQCEAVPFHRWDEQAYRFHYALDPR